MHVLLWLSIGLDRQGPSEHLLTAIVEALYEQGHTVHILQKNTGGNQGEMPARMVELGVTTTRIKCNQPKRDNLVARFLTDVRYVRNCRKWLRNAHMFHRVFLQSSNVAGIQMLVLRRFCKDLPVVFNVQDIFPENAVYSGALSAKGILYRMLSAMQRSAYRYADRVITISEDMKEQLIELGTQSDKVEVIYNWSYQDEMYDLSNLDYVRVAPFFDKSKFNVVYAGNIGRMQNVELLIHAAAKLRGQEDIAFHIFGEGVNKERLIALAHQLNTDNVAFHPMLDSRDAPALYASADVNVIPLAKNIYRTALPSKTATCLACGKPIIFALGKESIFGQLACRKINAQLVPSDDVGQLLGAIEKVRQEHKELNAEEYYAAFFSKSKNSCCYAKVITQ